MIRTMMKSKIHRATVTQADLNYVGSVTISSDLLEAADILPNEKVDIVSITTGKRLSTYAIAGPRYTGTIGINGAAAHLIAVDDIVIIIAYSHLSDTEARNFEPSVVFVDELNRPIHIGSDSGHVPDSSGLVSGRDIASAT